MPQGKGTRSGSKEKAKSSTTTKSKSRVESKGTARKASTGGRTRGSSTGKITTDHEEIRRWAEERDGQPACVKGTGGKEDVGMIRLDFPGYSGEQSLQPISWDEWFEKFDEKGLALVYQEETRGQKSNFNKLISRESAQAKTKPRTRAAGRK